MLSWSLAVLTAEQTTAGSKWGPQMMATRIQRRRTSRSWNTACLSTYISDLCLVHIAVCTDVLGTHNMIVLQEVCCCCCYCCCCCCCRRRRLMGSHVLERAGTRYGRHTTPKTIQSHTSQHLALALTPAHERCRPTAGPPRWPKRVSTATHGARPGPVTWTSGQQRCKGRRRRWRSAVRVDGAPSC